MIETHDLRRTFRSRTGPVEAVAGIDLRVEAGEVFGFLGPNGAGKTTTLRIAVAIMAILASIAVTLAARAFGRAVA